MEIPLYRKIPSWLRWARSWSQVSPGGEVSVEREQLCHEQEGALFFFFLCGRGKRRGEQRREWQGWKELGRLIKLVKAMDAPQRWIPWHLVFSGKSFVFLHLWFVILLSSSCSKISMKIYELWNISCFMWEKFVKVRERSTLGDEGFAEILGGILWISTGYDFGGFQGLALFDIKAVLTLQ